MNGLVCERAFLVGTRVADKLEGHGAVSLIDTNKGTPLPPPITMDHARVASRASSSSDLPFLPRCMHRQWIDAGGAQQLACCVAALVRMQAP